MPLALLVLFVLVKQLGKEKRRLPFATMCCAILYFALHCLSLHVKSLRTFCPKHSVLLCDPIVPELSPCSLDTQAKFLEHSVGPPLYPQNQSLSLCVCVRA